RVLHGNYEGIASHPVTILQGIRNHITDQTHLMYSKGCPLVDATEPNVNDPLFQEAIGLTRQAEVAIFVGGLSPAVEGEQMDVQYPGFRGGDRTSLELPACQQALLRAMYETGTPVILVLTSGSAIAVNWEDQHLPAIIQAWYPGQQGGNAVADVIFGDYNPAGRLPVTFYRSLDQIGDFNDYRMTSKTYRYFKGRPLYPFGHGLSYSTFDYHGLRLNKTTLGADEELVVTCTITNTSKTDGQEVVQLYVRQLQPRSGAPIKQLRGFERIAIRAGRSRQVRFRLRPSEDMSHYDPNAGRFLVEPGQFEIQIGASSQDIRLCSVVTVR
ncbi:MAG: glycoside hydrolase family 3 C-terminal domain-containing protein, partial [Sedimentisphaerales bacterium]|nr:glycoside hydrolase family 3 C-terminal domain-containing protein [Sedimentisphaerales bacterium]